MRADDVAGNARMSLLSGPDFRSPTTKTTPLIVAAEHGHMVGRCRLTPVDP